MAKIVTDHEEDETGDLVIVDGDFSVVDSARQHQKAIIYAHPGSFTQFPFIGVAIRNQVLNEVTPADIKAKITEHLEADGQSIDKIKVNADYSIDLEASFQ